MLAYRYQLAPEDAELLTQFSNVVFVDASETPLPEGYALEVCTPDSDAGVYTHQQTPGAVLYLANELYHHEPKAFLLTIQGFEWELGAALSSKAAQNLQRALVGFRRYFDLF